MFNIILYLICINYWLPFVEDEFIGPKDDPDIINIYAIYDSTHITSPIDTLLNAGNVGRIIEPPPPGGTKITSDKPVEVVYFSKSTTFGQYEPTEMMVSLLPDTLLGAEYWVPSLYDPPQVFEHVRICGTQNSTQLTVDGTNYTINEGQIQQCEFSSNTMHIVADKPVAVVHWSEDVRNTDQPHHFDAYQLLPVENWGKHYFCPLGHPSSGYSSPQIYNSIIIVAKDNNTQVDVRPSNYTLNQGERLQIPVDWDSFTITADKPIEVIYFFRINAIDIWTDVRKDYTNTASFNPIEAEIKETVIPPCPNPSAVAQHGWPFRWITVTSFGDSNNIKLDVGFDSIIELDTVLNFNQSLYLNESLAINPLTGWDTTSCHIFSTKNMQIMWSHRGWWAGYIEAQMAYVYKGSISSSTKLEEKTSKSSSILIYPNPFLSYTIINYEMADKICIYDIAGKLVNTFDLARPNGIIKWSGVDKNGNKLSPGVYFILLKTKQTTITKKLILLQ